MKPRRLAALLIVFLLSAPGLSAYAPGRPISGQPGTATQRATVNFADIARREAAAPATTEELQDVPYPLPGPRNRQLPPGAVKGKDESSSLNRVNAPALTTVSPPPAASFAALGDNNTRIPPDVHGAAGPSHLMTTLNSQVRIQNRTGGVISTVSLNSFWSSLSSPSAFDPKILYDPYRNRWIFTACSNSRSSSSSVLIGVTQTSDPTGTWNLYRIDADPANVAWADYPSFGFNNNWIVVQMNLFAVANDAFIRSNIYAFNKADLYAGGTGLFTLLVDTVGGFSQAPAITYDTTLSTMYLVEDWFGNSGGNGMLRICTITGPVGSEVYTPDVSFPTVADPWEDVGSTGFTDFAPQSGSVQKIMCNDARMQDCVYRNGFLWCTHTVFLPAGSGTRSGVQWWKLSTAGSILQRGRIEDPSGAVFYAFPSLAVNKNDDVVIGHSRFSASQFASGNYSFRAAGDPSNTFQTDTVLKVGEASYYKTFSGTRNRWGDYTGTVVDPVNDIDFWTIQEYAATPSGGFDRWGTWWGKVVPPAVPCAADTVRPNLTCPANIVKSNDIGQCNAVVTYTATAFDNCPGVTLACSPSSGSTFALGVTDVKCVATDAAGNKDSCVFTVTVNDTQKPTVACPANITLGNDPGQCGAAVTYSATAADNCAGVSLVCTPLTNSTFPIGATPVKCAATDAAGNKDSCTFTVTVNDAEPPVVNCPADITVSNDPGQCGAVVNFTALFSDNCPGTTLSFTPASGSTLAVGTTLVTCVATDGGGNKDTCTFNVTVNDTERPVAQCRDTVVIADSGQQAQVVNLPTSVSDNCPGATIVCTPPSGSSFPAGLTGVVCTATDASGNTAACSLSVAVQCFRYRGDGDESGVADIVDIVALINDVVFGTPLSNPPAGDTNCDGTRDIVDIVLLIQYVVFGTPMPCCL